MPAAAPSQTALSILIVSYNTRELSLACLASVYSETSTLAAPFEVVVVDNQSSDESAEAITVAFPDVHLIRATENLGLAAGNNLASNVARVDAEGFLLLLNPDTVVLERAVEKLYAFAKAHPEAHIFG